MNMRMMRGFAVAALASTLVLTGCASKSAARQQAGKGGGYGAFTGAVSGFFWGLLRGEALRGAAEGALVGGATGVVVGGVHGAGDDRALKAEYGNTNYKALMALVHRDYPAASNHAARTANDPNPQYRHASAWISALVAKETLGKDELESYYKRLIELDNDIETREDARVDLRLAERDLKALRNKFNVR